jgi:hypothetical protein
MNEKGERDPHLNSAQIEGEARVALPPLRADAREALPDPRRRPRHAVRCRREEPWSICPPWGQGTTTLGRNETAGTHAGVPDEEWRWTAPERRRTATKEPALWSMRRERAPCMLSPPPTARAHLSLSLSLSRVYAPRSAREPMAWGGGRRVARGFLPGARSHGRIGHEGPVSLEKKI